ncbi:tetratricopeptide repeat protein, partial [Nonomuraea sp. NPDC046802]|uniref:tetratricopeptide repeat protein n=1 Tax=Nonomuraea sp. NPDC046802 TaxID=3154919 RepID=UPI0033D6BADA
RDHAALAGTSSVRAQLPAFQSWEPPTNPGQINLAGAYESAGDLNRAIPLLEQTLTDRERVLGPDHPHTLTSRSNLAYAYESAGDLNRAIPLYEGTLTNCERVLGPDHPTTLVVRSNLEIVRDAVAGRRQEGGDGGFQDCGGADVDHGEASTLFT